MTTQRPWHPRVERPQIIALIALALLLIVCALFGTRAYAQAACTATSTTACFDASVKTGPAPITTTLTWSVPKAANCAAGGAGSVAAWTGSVPTSGTRNLSGINVNIKPTLDCVMPGRATITWVHGETVLTRTGYRIKYQAQPSGIEQSFVLAVPNATAYSIENLAPGPWLFKAATMTAFGDSADAVATPIAAAIPGPHTVAAGTPYHGEVQITVITPQPPTGVSVKDDPIAYEIRPDSSGKLVAQRIGVVRPGTVCASGEQKTVDGVTYSRVDRSTVDVVNFTNGSDEWVPVLYAKCG